MRNGKQIVGSTFAFSVSSGVQFFLWYIAISSFMFKLRVASFKIILRAFANESSKLVGISRPERNEASPRRNYFNVGCALCAGERLNWPCANFLSFLFFVLLLASQPPRHLKCDELLWSCIISTFSVEKCFYFLNLSRRIPHSNRNIQESF